MSKTLLNIAVIKDVAWLDERPQCQHLIACWRAGRDTGRRCAGHGQRRGQPSPGYCPISGTICAMEDATWTFAPGWQRWAEWADQERGYIDIEFWPGLKDGDLAAYLVEGECMTPTWDGGALAVVRIGNDWHDGDPCVISRRSPGLPQRGKLSYLKRLDRIGDKLARVHADNPTFEPFIMPVKALRVRGVALEGVQAEDMADRLATCHIFIEGKIEPWLWTGAVL